METVMHEEDKAMNRMLRVLYLYECLHKGEILVKKREAQRFQVDPRTIQRDLDEIRNYLAEHHTHERKRILYDRQKRGYVLKGNERTWLTNAEILLISKVILESRSLRKKEMDSLLKKMTLQAAPQERDHIENLLLNEKYHYVPVKHGKPLIETTWELSKAIQKKCYIEMLYKSVGKEAHWSLVKPVGLIFSEYYFYLLAYLTEHDFDFPTVFRVDRIQDYRVTEETFRIPYLERFEEGEFRKRVQFMYPGQLMRVQLIYRGEHLEAILDRLPTARILKREDGEVHLRAEVYGWGIRMWILSQGASLEVVKPQDFRQEIKETIQHMESLYQEE